MLHLLVLLTVSAQALDLQAVKSRAETMLEADLLLSLVETCVVEFDDGPASSAYHVVVPLTGSDSLVHVVLTAEAGFAREATLDQEIEGSVDSCTGDPFSLVTELEEQAVGIEVPVGVEKLFQEHNPLFGDLLIVVAQELDEELFGTLHFDLLTVVAT